MHIRCPCRIRIDTVQMLEKETKYDIISKIVLGKLDTDEGVL